MSNGDPRSGDPKGGAGSSAASRRVEVNVGGLLQPIDFGGVRVTFDVPKLTAERPLTDLSTDELLDLRRQLGVTMGTIDAELGRRNHGRRRRH